MKLSCDLTCETAGFECWMRGWCSGDWVGSVVVATAFVVFVGHDGLRFFCVVVFRTIFLGGRMNLS